MTTILHLIPTLEGGGAERQLVMLAAEQARRGWRVHIGLRRRGVYEKLLWNSGVIIHHLGDLRSLHPKLMISTYILIRNIKPDLIQTWLPQMDIIGGFITLWISIPWIASERVSAKSYLKTTFVSWLRCHLVKNAKAIIANSKQGALYWHQNLPYHQQIEVITNAVDVSAIRGAIPLSYKNIMNRKKIILSVGRLTKQKSHDLVIRATYSIHEQHDIQVVVIGNGELHGELVAMVRKYHLEDIVTVLPYQSDWWGLLQTANVLVSMSNYEGTPNVVLEAMAGECPLIVSDIPEHRDILDDASALFVQPGNVNALASSISSLLADPASATQRAYHASLRVNNLTIDSVANSYELVYEKVLARIGS